MIVVQVTRGARTGFTFESQADVVRVGRAADNDLVLPDEHVSSDHARVVYTGARWVLRDQRSTNGTAVVRGAERIRAPATGPMASCTVTLMVPESGCWAFNGAAAANSVRATTIVIRSSMR